MVRQAVHLLCQIAYSPLSTMNDDKHSIHRQTNRESQSQNAHTTRISKSNIVKESHQNQSFRGMKTNNQNQKSKKKNKANMF